MADYVASSVLKQAAIADESSTTDVFDRLATAVSRQFDREAEVVNDFFAAKVAGPTGVTAKTFRTNGTKYLQVSPYEAGSITDVSVDGVALDITGVDYEERDGFLVFEADYDDRTLVSVTARFGFDAIPVDIEQACIEQALFIWRRRDLAFAEMSGISTAALVAEFAPSFQATAKRYRDLYSFNNYFA